MASAWVRILAISAITLTSAAPRSAPSELPAGLAYVSHLRSVVEEAGACFLPGVSIKYDTFVPCLWRAVATGHVKHHDAVFINDGLRHGFTAGIDVTRLKGHRWFRNYKSAVTRPPVNKPECAKSLIVFIHAKAHAPTPILF